MNVSEAGDRADTAPPESPPFFFLTDPETAASIAEGGFAGSGVYNPRSTVTLLDRVPGEMSGAVVRILLTPACAKEAMRRESSDPGEGFRRFLVPMDLLRNAYIILVDRSEP